MSDRLREAVSALMDGEADELELKRLLTRSDAATLDQLKAVWCRYHRVRDILISQDQHAVSYRHLDISAGVSAAIADEPFDAVDKPTIAPNWMKPVAGFAVAASVAFAVVFSVRSIDPVDGGSRLAPSQVVASRVYPASNNPVLAQSGNGNVVVSAGYPAAASAPGTRALADLEAQKRLEKYMLRHTESAALNNGHGMISFARVVSFKEDAE